MIDLVNLVLRCAWNSRSRPHGFSPIRRKPHRFLYSQITPVILAIWQHFFHLEFSLGLASSTKLPQIYFRLHAINCNQSCQEHCILQDESLRSTCSGRLAAPFCILAYSVIQLTRIAAKEFGNRMMVKL